MIRITQQKVKGDEKEKEKEKTSYKQLRLTTTIIPTTILVSS